MNERYEIRLSASDSPIHYLESELSIGKFGQTLNLDHPDLSTKHCTFYLTENILSIKDHGSEKGTFINGDRIPAEQPIMITLEDNVKLGSLSVLIKQTSGDLDGVPGLPKLPTIPDVSAVFDAPIEELPFNNDHHTQLLDERSLITEINSEKSNELDQLEALDSEEDLNESFEVKSFDKNKLESKLKDKMINPWGIPYFIRLFALLIDINVTVFLTQLLIEYDNLLVLEPLLEAPSNFAASVLGSWVSYLIPYLVIFVLYTLLTNALLKRSLGQLLLLVSVEGSGLMGNLKAFGRSFLGLIVWPFIIFDFPSLFSKPTVKEAIFSSRFYLKSRIISFLLVILFLPASFILAYLTSFMERSPLEDFKSFEYKTITFSGNGNELGGVASQYFDFEKPKRSRTFLEYPNFKTIRKKDKRFIVPALRVYYPAKKVLVQFEKSAKKISLKKMLGFAIRTNPLASLRFKEIIKFVEDEPYNELKFYEEFKNLTKSSLELDKTTILDHLLQYGPFFKSFFDYRDSLVSSLDKKISSIRFVSLGERNFMKVTSPKGKFTKNNLVEEIFIPLERIQKPLFEFQIESEELIPEEMVLNFYRQYFAGLEWRRVKESSKLDTKTGAYEIIDYFSQKNQTAETASEEHAYIYRYYFKLGRLLVKSQNINLRNDYVEKLGSFLSMIIGLNQKERKKMDELRRNPLEEAYYDKLIKKTNELVEALKSQDLNFFGIAPKLETPQAPTAPTEKRLRKR